MIALNRDPLHLIEGDFILAVVVEFGRPGRGVVGDLLGVFQRTTVLHIGGDPGSAEGMVADPGEGIDHDANQRPITQTHERRLRRPVFLLIGDGQRNAVQQ
jgi:hypothetical protein